MPDGTDDARIIGVQPVGALPELAVVQNLRPVVRRHHHDRIVPQLQIVHLVQQMPHPPVHQRHLPKIQRLDALPLLVRGPAPFAGRPRHDKVLPGVVRHIPVRVFPRRIPWFVRIERIHPQEKRPVRRVLIQPLGCAPEHPRAAVILLALPEPLVEQILHQPPVSIPVHRLADMLLDRLLNRRPRAKPPVVALLPPDKIVGRKPPRVIHRWFEHVIRIGHQPGQIPPLHQNLRQRILLRRNLVPPRRVVPVSPPVIIEPPGERPPPRETRTPHLQRRLPFPKGPVEGHGLPRQRIQIGRFHKTQFLVRPHDICPKRIQTDADHVHLKPPVQKDERRTPPSRQNISPPCRCQASVPLPADGILQKRP